MFRWGFRVLGTVWVAVTLLASHGATGAEWPQFRGPDGLAAAPDQSVPDEFGPEKNVLWRRAVPAGHSSPIVSGDRDAASGETLWWVANQPALACPSPTAVGDTLDYGGWSTSNADRGERMEEAFDDPGDMTREIFDDPDRLVGHLDANGDGGRQGEELPSGRAYDAPMGVGDRVLIGSIRGSMFALGTGDELEIVARNRMGEGIVATPAFVNDTLYLRTERHLWAITDLSAARD